MEPWHAFVFYVSLKPDLSHASILYYYRIFLTLYYMNTVRLDEYIPQGLFSMACATICLLPTLCYQYSSKNRKKALLYEVLLS